MAIQISMSCDSYLFCVSAEYLQITSPLQEHAYDNGMKNGIPWLIAQ